MSLPNNPITRKEMYLSNMAGQGTALPSEPHTREEEYLDYIAKNGGGGGTGEGDMTKAVYDDDLAVASAGGIADYVAGAITGKVDKEDGKGLSSNDYDDSAKAIVDNVTTALDGKVSKSNTAGLLKNDGTVDTNTYAQTSALSGYIAKSNTAGLVKNDGTIDTTTTGAVAANTSAISAIKDGTNIDSFGDVETALDAKVTKLVAGGVLGTDGSPINVETPLTLSNGEIGLMFGNIAEGVQTSPPTAGDVYSALAPKANTSDVNSKFTATVDLLKDTTGWLGKNKVDSSKGTTSGTNIFTYNSSDKTVTANGTGGTNNSQYSIPLNVSGDFYFLGCPDGGAVDKYDIYLYDNTAGARVKQWDGVTQSLSNYGNTPCQAQIPEGHNVVMTLRVFAGHEVNNIVFKPMLITKEDYELSPTYEPYHESVEDWYWTENAKTGVHQLIPYPYVGDAGASGLTYTENADRSVTVSAGTSTGIFRYKLFENIKGSTLKNMWGNNSNMVLKGCPTGGTTSTYYIRFAEPYQTSNWSHYEDIGNGISFNTNDLKDNSNYTLIMAIDSGVTLANDITFNPLIKYKDDSCDLVTPYAMTNRELTDAVNQSAYNSTGLQYTRCSYVAGGYVKIGNICVVNIRVLTDDSTGNIQIDGFPSYNGKTLNSKNIIAANAFNMTDDSNVNYYSSIGTTGRLLVYGPVVAQKEYAISATYLCD